MRLTLNAFPKYILVRNKQSHNDKLNNNMFMTIKWLFHVVPKSI